MSEKLQKDLAGTTLAINGSLAIDRNKNFKARSLEAQDVTVKGILDISDATVIGPCSTANCDCAASNTCPLLPQPPTGKPASLIGENCMACFEQASFVQPCRDENASKVAKNYTELCEDLNSAYSYPPVTLPAKLVLTPDPAYVVPSGQKAAHPAPLPPLPLSLVGKHVLVVGASKGIGKACADRFYAEGAIVIGTSRHPDCYPATPYPLKTLDIRATINVKRFMDELFLTNWTNGQIDILVLLPGIHTFGELADSTGDDMMDAFNLMVAGYQRCVYFALPHMRHSDETRIISFGSSAGEIPQGAIITYSMAKRALQFWNDGHQAQSMQRKARGQVTYEPTWSLVEPGDVLTSIGLWEYYKPNGVPITNASLRKEEYSIAYFQNVIAPNTVAEMAEIVYRIAVAPQPGVRYLADNDTPYPFPPPNTIAGLTILSNTISADDAVNLANQVNSGDGVAELGIVKAAYC